MSSYLCQRKLHKKIIKMEQKKDLMEHGGHFSRLYLEIDAPIGERTLCVPPGTLIRLDKLTFLCVESLTSPHCVGCDASHEVCDFTCCSPYDRNDGKYVQFKCVCVDE